MPRRPRLCPARSALLALVLVAAGCQVDTVVTVDVADDGSGTVSVDVALDAEAVDQVPRLGRQLRTDDLEAAGWTVSGPDDVGADGRLIQATKPFASPAELSAVLGEVGPITDATLTRDRPFAGVDFEFSATVDLSDGVEGFGDEALAELLIGLPIGRDVEALEEELGAPLTELTSFELVVLLPDGDRTERVARAVELGEGPVVVTATTSETEPWAIGLRWGALAAAALLVLLLGYRLVRWLLRRRQDSRASDDDADLVESPSTT